MCVNYGPGLLAFTSEASTKILGRSGNEAAWYMYDRLFIDIKSSIFHIQGGKNSVALHLCRVVGITPIVSLPTCKGNKGSSVHTNRFC